MARHRAGDDFLGGRDVRWRVAIGLTLLAFVHRFFFFHSNADADWAFSVFYEGDAEIFHNYARAIRAGRSYDGGVPFHPPGFPYLLSFVHALTGAGVATVPVDHAVVRLVFAALSSVAVGAVYVVATPFVGRLAATVGAGFLLYSFGHYVVSVNPTSEGVTIVLTLVLVGLWTRMMPGWGTTDARGRPWTRAVIFGGLGGLLILTRAEGALLVGVMAIVGGIRSWRETREGVAIGPWAVAAICTALVIVPWAVRNHERMSEINRRLGPELAEPLSTFVPVTVYGPLNLALANHGAADGTFSRDLLSGPAGSSQLDLKNPEHLRLFNHGDEIAWSWIRANPGAFAALVVQKWRLAGDALGLGFTQWNAPAGHHGFRRPVDLFVTSSPWGFAVVLSLLIAGAITLARGGAPERRWLFVVGLVTAASAAVVGLFFGYARFGVMLLPFWFTLPGAAVAGGVGRLARRGGDREPAAASRRMNSRTGQVLVGLAALLLVLEAWGATGHREFTARGSQLPGADHLNPHATIYLDVQSN